jgi:hypothetical protein
VTDSVIVPPPAVNEDSAVADGWSMVTFSTSTTLAGLSLSSQEVSVNTAKQARIAATFFKLVPDLFILF